VIHHINSELKATISEITSISVIMLDVKPDDEGKLVLVFNFISYWLI
jgi:hypothetical protein